MALDHRGRVLLPLVTVRVTVARGFARVLGDPELGNVPDR
jgi:hypothetical protein